MANEKILIVDDEEDIIDVIRYNLAKQGYIVFSESSGESAVEKALSEIPDLVLLDLMLPGLDGLEACKILKNNTKTAHVPIIMITAKGEEADIVTGLELGADDYVTKPFSPRVLLARIKSVLRRRVATAVDDATTVRIHDIVVNPKRHEVVVSGKSIDLTVTEFNLLHFLARRPGWVFTRNQIIESVQGEGYPVTDRSVDVQVVGLRKKLGKSGDYIETVRGVGYRFKD